MSRLALVLLAALSVAACKTAAPIHPLAEEHNQKCAEYLAEGYLDKAQHRCELAQEYNPDYAEPFNNLCLIWIKRNDLDKAKGYCIKALRLNNDFAQAHNNLGYIYLQDKSYGKAHDSFANALKINPGYLEARYNLCLSLLRLKKGEQARVCYDKIIEIAPNVADPYHDLCVLDLEDDKLPDAVQNCGKALSLDPKFTDAYFHLGRAYQASGKHCEAQDAYKQCVAIDDAHAECRNNLSSAVRHCALQSPHVVDAKDDAARENTPESFLALGLEEKDRGLLVEAERHFRKCIKLDGRFGPCYCQLAAIGRKEAKEEARTNCRKCLSYSAEEETSPEREACQRMLKSED